MRIINLTTNKLTLTDIDRGIERDRDIYESWNGKADNVIPASISTTGYVDILDTERVLMSNEIGQIKKFRTAGKVVTFYSITGRNIGPFEITGANNTFEVAVSSYFGFMNPSPVAINVLRVAEPFITACSSISAVPNIWASS